MFHIVASAVICQILCFYPLFRYVVINSFELIVMHFVKITFPSEQFRNASITVTLC